MRPLSKIPLAIALAAWGAVALYGTELGFRYGLFSPTIPYELTRAFCNQNPNVLFDSTYGFCVHNMGTLLPMSSMSGDQSY